MITYPLETSEAEIARLLRQSDALNDSAVDLMRSLDIQPGWRCLDLCCGVGDVVDLIGKSAGINGEVIGLDIDPIKLQIADERRKALRLSNVVFIQDDAFNPTLERGTFDLVHCRFAMGVIRDGVSLLETMISLVKPGGLVVAQEADSGLTVTYPPLPEWDRTWELINEAFRIAGADLFLGRQLFHLFSMAGLKNVKANLVINKAFSGSHHVNQATNSLNSLRRALIEHGSSTDAEINELTEAVKQHVKQPNAMSTHTVVYQVWGKKRYG